MSNTHNRKVLLTAALTAYFSLLQAALTLADDASGKALRFPISKTDLEWKQILTPEQYQVMRAEGTERPFSGQYDRFSQHGIYRCAACGNPLFLSDTKYDPGEGWPSFWSPYSPTSILTKTDNSLFMQRTEVICKRCGSHLGHVFNDGPKPTGQRYCINSVALKFEKTASDKKN